MPAQRSVALDLPGSIPPPDRFGANSKPYGSFPNPVKEYHESSSSNYGFLNPKNIGNVQNLPTSRKQFLTLLPFDFLVKFAKFAIAQIIRLGQKMSFP
jgi:hypothetical protein